MLVSKDNNFTNFYKSCEGQIFKEIISKEIHNYWSEFENENILSFGYHFEQNKLDIATFGKENEYSEISINHVALPFENESINKILVYNYLEFLSKRKLLFKEFWRVLSPRGLLLVIVPNKNSIIKLNKIQAYKNLKLFSLYQILELMNKSDLTTMRSSSRIFCIAKLYKLYPKICYFIDNICSKWLIPFGGFIFVEAKKDIAQPIQDMDKKIFAYRHF